MRLSASDPCSAGDVLFDQSAPGWTQTTDADFCPVWVPPPGTKQACFATRPAADAGVAVTTASTLYAGICVTALAGRDPKQAFRFYAESQFTPKPAPAGKTNGTLTLTLSPLVGWDVPNNTPKAPASISKAEVRGATVSMTTSVSSDAFVGLYPKVDLVPEANSISGRAVVIENLTLDGDGFTDGGPRFCARLSGQLTVPYSFALDPNQNTCLFVQVKEGEALPVLEANEFKCH